MSNKASSDSAFDPLDYAGSPVHYAVALADHHALTEILSSLPKLPDPTRFQSESDSIAQERLADQISAVLDRRDNRLRETPLHLSVRLNDAASTRLLAAAGANASLQNAAGWNPLQEAVLRRRPDIVSTLVQQQNLAAWSKWRRRRPLLVGALRRMRDFYMEICFHFESSVVPFLGKIAPSDTYRIWKRDGNLRADTSLAGFDGLRIQRTNQSFLFLNNDLDMNDCGTLLVLNHDDRKVYHAFEAAGSPLSDSDVSNFCNQTSVYRPGMDVTEAELIGRTNWRFQEKTESVGEWKARVYDMHNVTFSFRSRKVAADVPLGKDEDLIVAENPRLNEVHRRHSSFAREEREFGTVSRKSVDANFALQTKEKEYAKSLRPTVWLTDQFPLKTEELVPLLDILANKVKAVRRMRELLTTTFPAGTFPVKVAIPVVPTVRVVITFTKFVELPPVEESFYTPLSSPMQFEVELSTTRSDSSSCLSSSSVRSGRDSVADPFAIPGGYSWGSLGGKNRKQKKKSMF